MWCAVRCRRNLALSARANRRSTVFGPDSVWHGGCSGVAMKPARHYSELIFWQLADRIRHETFQLTNKPAFAADGRAHSQVDDAVNSVCRNIAEGFGCETHREFARYLAFSRRSMNELLDGLHAAQMKGYITAADVEPIRRLSHRYYPAIGRFIAYLKRTPNFRVRRDSERGNADLHRRRRTDLPSGRNSQPQSRSQDEGSTGRRRRDI